MLPTRSADRWRGRVSILMNTTSAECSSSGQAFKRSNVLLFLLGEFQYTPIPRLELQLKDFVVNDCCRLVVPPDAEGGIESIGIWVGDTEVGAEFLAGLDTQAERGEGDHRLYGVCVFAEGDMDLCRLQDSNAADFVFPDCA